MQKEKLNRLVASYQGGNKSVIDDIFREVNPFIERASRELESFVTEFTKFDCRVITKVHKLAKTFCIEKHDFLSSVKAIISNEKADFFRRRTDMGDEISKEFLEESKEEDGLGYQFADPLARVEDEVTYKEKITLLAQGDLQKETILYQWTKGASDSEISKLLAQLFGGKAESKRKSVTRFRVECKRKLRAELS